MKFINDTSNLRFWPLLVLVLVGIAVLSILYESNIYDVQNRYNEKVSELDSAYASLESFEGDLNKSQEELNLRKLREDTLSDNYQGLQGDLEELEDKYYDLQVENEDLKEKAAKVDALERKVENLQEDVEKWENLYREELLKNTGG